MIAKELYPDIWIIPNPGDGGSSMGCAAYALGEHINFNNCFLGYEIRGRYPTKKVLKELLSGNIVGVANGRAEFGPRALGNRSLIADPRGKDIKDKVNEIKHRQKFRPFAPSVLEEHAHEIFEMPVKKSQFMQFVAQCKYPKKYPAICHVDGTSRVQTVSKQDNPGYYRLIKEFYKATGCPMVLNTSLNIKGQPIVNSYIDAVGFSKRYKVNVY
jgi:carbamoyltransferase